MSNNLQQVFSKFGFKTKKNRGDKDRKISTRRIQSENTNNRDRDRESDSDDYKQTVSNHNRNNNNNQQQQPPHPHHSSHSQNSLNKLQRAYLQQQREYLQQQQLRALQKKKKHHSQHHQSGLNNNNNIMSQYNPTKSNKPNPSFPSNPQNHSSSSKHATSSSSSKRSTKSRTKQHHPNGAYNHLDPKAFSQNMTECQIQKLMGLRTAPSYRTDEKGYIDFQPGLFVRKHFVVIDTLGRGTFSKVFEAVDVMDQTKIAIKVIRNTHRYIEAAKTELRVLQHITNADDGTSACIHLKDHFSWNNHPCFVFKLYGPSIYTVMSRNRFRPFPDCIARSLTFQICNAIQFLHHLGIIFTDLKPENMVFVDGRTYPVKIHG
eukprot:420613_1